MRLCLSFTVLLMAFISLRVTAQEPLQVPPPTLVPSYQPFLGLPSIQLDEANNGIGVAQHVAREKGVQGRVLWIDGLANIDRINTAEKIRTIVTQVKDAGFNTIVLDVKPIPGLTLYPSKYAPKMTEWWGKKAAG